MRTGLLEAVALLALGSCLHVCKAQNSTTNTLFQYLTALEENRTFYYEPANPAYYAAINNNTIIEFNGTFYEDFNGTFYALQRQANGTLYVPQNATAITEGENADGKLLASSSHAGSTLKTNTCCGYETTSRAQRRRITVFSMRFADRLSWSNLFSFQTQVTVTSPISSKPSTPPTLSL